ncbi:MAG: DUF2007 domain-containing protein [Acidobacteriota bacterium]|jgi:hypothetical protein
MPNVEMVTVFEADNLTALSLAESALEDAGVEYVTVGQRLYAAGFPVNRPVWIQVSREDEARAEQALEHLRTSHDNPPDDVDEG